MAASSPPGYDANLDELRQLATDTKVVLAKLQAAYAAQTGIKTLKIQYNQVFGYFVEVSPGTAAALQAEPHSAVFRHKQTLANAVRFTTDELSALESRILNATSEALARELALFDELAGAVLAAEDAIANAAAALAALDCTASLADLAQAQNYVRPHVDDSRCFLIEGGRHPAVEQALARDGGAFIGNECKLDGAGERAAGFLVVTGPNMAGKSTYLRQNALLAVLAQAGAYVPATSAHIGVADRLFARIGAADDLARGRSTFMVEMTETAAILNQATRRSFVILDEIGRGTATFDGLSIAWAVLEHLHDVILCRGLVATHYHELTRLADDLPRAANVRMAVTEWKDSIVFLHAVEAGPANRSYGVQAARLAGVPKPVLARAKQVLAQLENGAGPHGPLTLPTDMPLFCAPAKHAADGRRAASRAGEARRARHRQPQPPRSPRHPLCAQEGASIAGSNPAGQRPRLDEACALPRDAISQLPGWSGPRASALPPSSAPWRRWLPSRYRSPIDPSANPPGDPLKIYRHGRNPGGHAAQAAERLLEIRLACD